MALDFFLNHSSIPVLFSQTHRDFVVEEIPLYDFLGEGEHLVVQIRKKNLSTEELLKLLSSHLGIKAKEIGYAGLKDKNALTSQFISIPYLLKEKLETLNHPLIKILQTTRHHNKIKIGHLKGNRFFVRLKKVTPQFAQKILNILPLLENQGFPNYFGYQRFGKDGDNYNTALEIIKKQKKLRDKKLNVFLMNALQSYYFNEWLSARITFSKVIGLTKNTKELKEALQITLPSLANSPIFLQNTFLNTETFKALQNQTQFFKLLLGDICCHYPFGKYFTLMEYESSKERFIQKEIVPTGILCGDKVMEAVEDAKVFEKAILYDKILPHIKGTRRFAWVFVENLSAEYKEQEAWLELKFSLPKGAYATSFLRELLHTDLKAPKNLNE